MSRASRRSARAPRSARVLECKNCGVPVDDRFCPACGQSIDVDRFTFRRLAFHVLEAVASIEHPFLKTCWGMVTRPGQLISNYVEGQRVRYMHPFKFCLMAAAAAYFVQAWLLSQLVPDLETAIVGQDPFRQEFTRVQWSFQVHQRLWIFALMPVLAIFFRLAFWGSGRNYVEQLSFILFTYGAVYFLQMLLMPFVLLAPAIAGAMLQIVAFGIPSWAAIRFNRRGPVAGIVLSLLAHAIFWTGVGLAWFVIAMIRFTAPSLLVPTLVDWVR